MAFTGVTSAQEKIAFNYIFITRGHCWRNPAAQCSQDRRVTWWEVHLDVAQVRRWHQLGDGRWQDTASHLGRERYHRGLEAAPVQRRNSYQGGQREAIVYLVFFAVSIQASRIQTLSMDSRWLG